MEKLRVAVLMGGKSDERKVSLSTGAMIMKALDPEKYTTIAVDTGLGFEDGEPYSESVSLGAIVGGGRSAFKPDVAFIALHGKYGEDGTVQGLLELFGIPYVGSGVLASALAMDKIMARKMLEHEGIPVPKGIAIRSKCDLSTIQSEVEDKLGYPVVVKPNRQGSTIGLSIAHSGDELLSAIDLAFKYDKDVLLEEFISGTEITCPVLGNDDLEALPVVEIVPQSGFYDYEAKYTAGATEEIVPARIAADLYKSAQEFALACHRALRCRGMSRTDIIVRDTELFVLEVNTIPGMTPTSLLPRSAQAAGIEFPQLLDRLIEYSLDGGHD